MPIGYLVAVLVMAVATASALAGADTPRPTVMWIVAAVANEVPFLIAVALVASTALAAAEGDLLSPLGLLALTLAFLTGGGLLRVARRGLTARVVLAGALADSLPARRLPAAQTTMPAGHPWPRLLLAPLPFTSAGLRRERHLRYGTAGEANRLDLYHRRHGADGPILVYFHGGGFRSGRRNREARPLLHRLASDGWICITANYSLARHGASADPFVDAKRAVAWATEYGPGYGGDPARVVVAGSSAGGHLAAWLALTGNDPTLQPGAHHSFDLFRSARFEAVVDAAAGFTALVWDRAWDR